ncbi:pilus assembly protein PilM [PVC group bacterium]|nr:pilus assembly protein PilM [PVC group bacterium]
MHDNLIMQPRSQAAREFGRWQNFASYGFEMLTRPLFSKSQFYGIDFGHSSWKAVLINRKGNTFHIKDIQYLELPDVSQIQKIDSHLFRKFVTCLDESIRQCHIQVSGKDVSIQLLNIPRIPRSEMMKAVSWEMSKALPFDVTQAQVSFYPIPYVRGIKNKILGVAGKKSFIEERIDVLADAGFALEDISIIPLALEQLIKSQLVQVKNTSVIMIVEIGSHVTTLCFFYDSQLLFARQINMGSTEITQSITGTIVSGEETYSLNQDDAEEIKKRYGFPLNISETDEKTPRLGLGQIAAMMRPVLERWVTECKRSLQYATSSLGIEGVQEIYLSGGGSKLKNLETYLSSELECPVSKLHFHLDNKHLDLINSRDIVPDHPLEFVDFSVAMGLALPHDGARGSGLLPDHHKHRKRPLILKAIFLWPSIAALICLILFSILIEVTRLERIQAYNYSLAVEEKLFHIQEKIQKLAHTGRDLKEKSQNFREFIIQDRFLWDGLLKELSHVVGPDITLSHMGVHQKHMELRGLVQAKRGRIDTAVAQFIEKLEKSPFVLKASVKTISKQTLGEDERAEFQVECTLF